MRRRSLILAAGLAAAWLASASPACAQFILTPAVIAAIFGGTHGGTTVVIPPGTGGTSPPGPPVLGTPGLPAGSTATTTTVN